MILELRVVPGVLSRRLGGPRGSLCVSLGEARGFIRLRSVGALSGSGHGEVVMPWCKEPCCRKAEVWQDLYLPDLFL